MYLFVCLGKKVSPREVAAKIVQNLDQHDVIDKTEVANPGFINIYLSKDYSVRSLSSIFENGIRPPVLDKKLRVLVDFSSPNVAKEMHVGHLR